MDWNEEEVARKLKGVMENLEAALRGQTAVIAIIALGFLLADILNETPADFERTETLNLFLKALQKKMKNELLVDFRQVSPEVH